MDLYIKDKVGFRMPAHDKEKRCVTCKEIYHLHMFRENKTCNVCVRKDKREKYRSAHPKEIGARAILKIALKSGHLIKQPCEKCGAISNVDGHHPDYEKPLDIIWLCRAHHMQEHSRLKLLSDGNA